MNCKCAICGAHVERGYTLSSVSEDYTLHFCSKVHLVEFIAPELSKVCVPKQWIPTDEEIERMHQ